GPSSCRWRRDLSLPPIPPLLCGLPQNRKIRHFYRPLFAPFFNGYLGRTIMATAQELFQKLNLQPLPLLPPLPSGKHRPNSQPAQNKRVTAIRFRTSLEKTEKGSASQANHYKKT